MTPAVAVFAVSVSVAVSEVGPEEASLQVLVRCEVWAVGDVGAWACCGPLLLRWWGWQAEAEGAPHPGCCVPQLVAARPLLCCRPAAQSVGAVSPGRPQRPHGAQRVEACLLWARWVRRAGGGLREGWAGGEWALRVESGLLQRLCARLSSDRSRWQGWGVGPDQALASPCLGGAKAAPEALSSLDASGAASGVVGVGVMGAAVGALGGGEGGGQSAPHMRLGCVQGAARLVQCCQRPAAEQHWAHQHNWRQHRCGVPDDKLAAPACMQSAEHGSTWAHVMATRAHGLLSATMSECG